MAQLYLFNPSHKLRFLSRLLFRRSKRLLRNTNTPIPLPTTRCKDNANLAYALPGAAGDYIASSEFLAHDPDFYLRDTDGGFCVFKVENTLFKVHRCLLLREPSAFTDMFSLPNIYSEEGKDDSSPIVLSDTVEQFRDLLWILYAPPSIFLESPTRSPVSLKRLLNIAEMTHKYCFESYSSWAIDHLTSVVQEPAGPLRNASPELLSRLLHIAALYDHQILLAIVTRHVISRLLWYDMRPDPILEIAERHRLAKVIGVIYYKRLISMEQASPDGRTPYQLVFPPNIGIEKRMELLAAHHSLVKLWKHLQSTPPSFHHEDCADPDECDEIWAQLWLNAGCTQRLRDGSADVLGRLKVKMINLRRTLTGTTSMGVRCTLAALESISQARDDIIDGLIDHFVEL